MLCPSGGVVTGFQGTYNELPYAAFTSIGPLTCSNGITTGVAGAPFGPMWTHTAVGWYTAIGTGRFFGTDPCEYIFTITLEGRQKCRKLDYGQACDNNGYTIVPCDVWQVAVGVTVQTVQTVQTNPPNVYVVGLGLICSPACDNITISGANVAQCTKRSAAGRSCSTPCTSGVTNKNATVVCSSLGGGWNVVNPCGTSTGEACGSCTVISNLRIT